MQKYRFSRSLLWIWAWLVPSWRVMLRQMSHHLACLIIDRIQSRYLESWFSIQEHIGVWDLILSCIDSVCLISNPLKQVYSEGYRYQYFQPVDPAEQDVRYMRIFTVNSRQLHSILETWWCSTHVECCLDFSSKRMIQMDFIRTTIVYGYSTWFPKHLHFCSAKKCKLLSG